MNIYFYILPRQVGKTGMAIAEFLKDMDNTLFVCCNMNMVTHIKQLLHLPPSKHNILSYRQLLTGGVKGKRINKIIFDEYLFMSAKDRKIIDANIIPCLESNGEILIYSTPNVLYDPNLYNLVKTYKKLGYSINKINTIVNKCKKINVYYEDIEELYYNYLTHPITKIISAYDSGHISPLLL